MTAGKPITDSSRGKNEFVFCKDKISLDWLDKHFTVKELKVIFPSKKKSTQASKLDPWKNYWNSWQ